MSWFATDDRFWSHRKVMRLRRSEYYAQAVAVWCLSGSWCSGDDAAKHTGHVHFDVIAGLGIRDWELGVKALVESRLFDETPDPEVVGFHDWELWNGPDAKTKRLERRLEADRVRQQIRRSGGLREGSSRDQSTDSPTSSRDSHVRTGYGKGKGVGSSKGSKTEDVTTSRRVDDESKPKTTRKPKPVREDAQRLCEHLAQRVIANGCKPPTISVRWLDAARLLMDSDGRTEEQIHRAIDWCQDSSFWWPNVQSMPTLREKYDTLRGQAEREAKEKREKEEREKSGTVYRTDQPRAGSGVWDRPVRPEGGDAA
jgi:hypothetical protein